MDPACQVLVVVSTLIGIQGGCHDPIRMICPRNLGVNVLERSSLRCHARIVGESFPCVTVMETCKFGTLPLVFMCNMASSIIGRGSFLNMICREATVTLEHNACHCTDISSFHVRWVSMMDIMFRLMLC